MLTDLYYSINPMTGLTPAPGIGLDPLRMDITVMKLCFILGRENASQKYIWVTDGKTWTEAQSYCREKYTDLASVRNETEHRQILSLSLGHTVWIGLHRNRLWSDQSNSSFTYWRQMVSFEASQPDNGFYTPGQNGNQHCTAVSLQHFGQWTDEQCYDSLPFFCYSGYTMGLRVKFTSVESLSKSQIEVLIIQLQEEFIRQGVPSNFTMHLRKENKIAP
ncbi:aggrecan core protein-like [Megalobrama amblycephala]|uniref:aggrecan core protein-like n=1 Tax=Megalobrama amblycephala TaxID=75352 RepID=UPI002013EE68|nr:aggrecan core protein-like [Megalobrama amblycephala]